MRKAIFFEEAYKQGILPNIAQGLIFSVNAPDIDDVSKKLDPYNIKMISYTGLKTVIPIEGGVKFQAQGKSMFSMVEPVNYPRKHEEPASRSQNSTGYMPFRFSECETFFTKDNNFRIIIPKIAHESFDSFTINFPHKGDICVLYYIFDENIEGAVFPFMEENIAYILKAEINLKKNDALKVSKQFMQVVRDNYR